MDTILLVIHLLIAIALVITVLLQRSEGGALGMGGGGGSGGPSLFSARGTANALTRATAILAACFMGTSLFLAVLASRNDEGESFFDRTAPQVEDQAPAAPAGPAVPTTE